MRPYFFTCLFISFVGSILTCVYWYIDLLNRGYYRHESGFSFGFDYFISVFVIAVFLSFFSSLIVTTIIWLFESLNGNRFLPILHISLLVIAFMMSAYMRLIKDLFLPFFGCYYLPGVVGYYLFVHRSRKKIEPETELLDRT
jgi:hypothetical protein